MKTTTDRSRVLKAFSKTYVATPGVFHDVLRQAVRMEGVLTREDVKRSGGCRFSRSGFQSPQNNDAQDRLSADSAGLVTMNHSVSAGVKNRVNGVKRTTPYLQGARMGLTGLREAI
jgi:hypothetical protein